MLCIDMDEIVGVNSLWDSKQSSPYSTKRAKAGAHLPLLGLECQCDARPSYLPSCKASPPIGWYQIILLGDRGTSVLTTCPGLYSTAERPGFELATY